MTTIGIHDISLATTHYRVELDDLAAFNGTDPAKYRKGLGQDRMSFPAPDEDIVTMGAAAALPIIREHGTDGIRTVLFATESGVDQSKSAGVFVHRLLGLPAHVRTVEYKQACYGATAALHAALGIIARSPGERVLIIASDVASYDLDSPGEPTQGAGAVAMLIAENPALVAIDPQSGVHTADVDDFWRPNDAETAVVDGALSVRAYLDALTGAWDDYRAQHGADFSGITRFCYHQPFTKMAKKAHLALTQHVDAAFDESAFETTLTYNRQLGNTYTASLYAGLIALLDTEEDLAGERIGLFSYGSGSVGEFFSGVVQPGYRSAERAARSAAAIANREHLPIDRYRELHEGERGSSAERTSPSVTAAPFRFAGVHSRARHYAATV